MKVYRYFVSFLKSFYLKFFLKSYFKEHKPARKKERSQFNRIIHTTAGKIPVDNWYSVTDGDIEYIFISLDKEPEVKEPYMIVAMDRAWDNIVSEYIDTTGIKGTYAKLLDAEGKLAILQYRFAKTHDTKLNLPITILKEKIDELNKVPGMDRHETMSYLIKGGYNIDTSTMNLLTYCHCIKGLEKKVEDSKRIRNGK